ncbi:restriction endonuclease subunit S [Alkalinema sp. FACHB-956]|uniref:restriction endonuclease subunit S n=1 Tax=Alkalinema sp. FACHB-956 TaxID=2692768 RepID=UPI001684E9B3|nr:restriction endonuclease subunit S [Alkalinema sp. FACHB-956]MBD2329551.1 restriction endonuclease subunit S [Alkalinema sp. FACHB-956]
MNWQHVSLRSIATVITKGTTPTSIGHGFSDTGIPFLRVHNIHNHHISLDDVLFIDETTDEALARSRIYPKDVLVSIAGTVGRTAVVPPEAPPMNCNQAVAIIRPQDGVNPYYLSYWFNTEAAIQQIQGLQVTGTIANLSLSGIQTLHLPLPSLPEQQRMVAILDRAHAVRQKRKQAIQLMEDLLRSIFLDQFGDSVTKPKGWNRLTLGEMASIQKGLHVTPKRQDYPLEVPYLRVANVYRDQLHLEDLKTMRVTPQELQKIKLEKGDLLLVEGHGNPEEIGRSAVWDGSMQTCVYQNHLIRVRVDPKIADPTYISTYLNSEGGRRQFTKFGKTTSGLNTITASNVKAITIVCPPLELQQQYCEWQRQLTHTLQIAQASFQESEALFNTLLQRTFRGELQPVPPR